MRLTIAPAWISVVLAAMVSACVGLRDDALEDVTDDTSADVRSDADLHDTVDAVRDGSADARDAGEDAPTDVTTDAGPLDGETMDATTDAGGPDAMLEDTHPVDSGPPDAPPIDTGPPDTGPIDTGVHDTGPIDTGVPDTGPADTGSPTDMGVVDGGCATSGFVGAVATYDLTGQPGNEMSAPATAMGGGVVAGGLGRSATLTPTAGANSINSSAWTMATSVDATKYYTFTVTPAAGCTMTLTSLAITTLASGTGPLSFSVATSADGFVPGAVLTPGTTMTVPLSVSAATGAIEVRIYGFGARSTAGTFRIENPEMVLDGSID